MDIGVCMWMCMGGLPTTRGIGSRCGVRVEKLMSLSQIEDKTWATPDDLPVMSNTNHEVTRSDRRVIHGRQGIAVPKREESQPA